jgi:hypothetical protein
VTVVVRRRVDFAAVEVARADHGLLRQVFRAQSGNTIKQIRRQIFENGLRKRLSSRMDGFRFSNQTEELHFHEKEEKKNKKKKSRGKKRSRSFFLSFEETLIAL